MQILYLYKVILHAVPNAGFEWTYCPRNKLTMTPKISRNQGWAHTLRNSSFSVVGPKLFNSLPKEIRELPDLSKTKKQLISSFKTHVDKYLSTIPDVPGTKNSLLDHEGIEYGYQYTPLNSADNNNSNINSNNQNNTNSRKRRRMNNNNYFLTDERKKMRIQSRWDDGPVNLI